jgi:hypothetical protein
LCTATQQWTIPEMPLPNIYIIIYIYVANSNVDMICYCWWCPANWLFSVCEVEPQFPRMKSRTKYGSTGQCPAKKRSL